MKLFFALLVLSNIEFSAQQANLQPSDLTYYSGSKAVLTCHSAKSINTTWIINGSILPFNQENQRVFTGIGYFNIPNVSVYNSTCIQCEAIFSGFSRLSQQRYIRVQGIPCPVSSLQYRIVDKELINISWNASFHLDIPQNDVDVTYCVDILNSTSLSIVDSSCGIIDSHHICNTLQPLLACSEYLIHVKASNPVGNSSIKAIKVEPIGFAIVNVSRLSSLDAMNILFRIYLTHDVCAPSSVLRNNNEEIQLNGGFSSNFNTLDFELQSKGHYNLTLDYSTSNLSFPLGYFQTYYIQDIFASDNGSNDLFFRSSFVLDAKPAGVICVLMYIANGNVDFSKSLYFALEREAATDGVLLKEIPSGTYLLLAYDINPDGFIQSHGVSAVSMLLNITGSPKNGVRTWDNSDCKLERMGLSFTLVCYCDDTDYFHVLLQKADDDLETVRDIVLAKRSSCLDAVSLDNLMVGTYFAAIFLQKSDVGFSEKLHYGIEFTVIENLNTPFVFIPTPASISETNAMIVVIIVICVIVIFVITLGLSLVSVYGFQKKCKRKKFKVAKNMEEVTKSASMKLNSKVFYENETMDHVNHPNRLCTSELNMSDDGRNTEEHASTKFPSTDKSMHEDFENADDDRVEDVKDGAKHVDSGAAHIGET